MTKDQLRATLIALNLKQTHAAKLLGVDPSTMRRWIQGVREVHPCAARLLWLMDHEQAVKDNLNWPYGFIEMLKNYPVVPDRRGHFW